MALISSLKDLEQVIKIMRKTGVQHMVVEGIELTLGPEPTKAPKATKQVELPEPMAPGGITEDLKIPTDFPTMQELLDWSVGSDQQ